MSRYLVSQLHLTVMIVVATTAVLMEWFPLGAVADAASDQHQLQRRPRRCLTPIWNQAKNLSLQQLHQQTICEACTKLLPRAAGSEIPKWDYRNASHVVLLHWQEWGNLTKSTATTNLVEMRTIAAGLLLSKPNLHVSFLYIVNNNTKAIMTNASTSTFLSELERRTILDMLPCDVESTAKTRLSVQVVQPDGIFRPSCSNRALPTTPFDDVCALVNTRQQLSFFQRYFVTANVSVDVLVAHANLISAVWLAETLNKPIVLLASPMMVGYLTDGGNNGHGPFAPTTATATSNNNNNHWFRTLYHAIRHRWHKELGITYVFWVMNRVRRRAGLDRLKVPSDYIHRFVAGILVRAHPFIIESTQKHPSFISMVHPLVPPCIPCEEMTPTSRNNGKVSPSSSNTTTTAVLLVLPLDNCTLSENHIRLVVRGLAFARESLRTMSKHCQGDDCAPYTDLTVVWLLSRDEEQTSGMLLPSFVVRERSSTSSPLLDILSRYPHTTGVIGPCGGMESLETYSVGLQFLCTSSSSSSPDYYSSPSRVKWLNVNKIDARTLAWHILTMLLDHARDTEPTLNIYSGVYTATSVIEVAATSFQSESQQQTRLLDEGPLPEWMVFIAWSILLTFWIYLCVKNRLPPTWIRELRRMGKSRTPWARWLTTNRLELDRAVQDVCTWWTRHTSGSARLNNRGDITTAAATTQPRDSMEPILQSNQSISMFASPTTIMARDGQQHQLRRRRGGGKKR